MDSSLSVCTKLVAQKLLAMLTQWSGATVALKLNTMTSTSWSTSFADRFSWKFDLEIIFETWEDRLWKYKDGIRKWETNPSDFFLNMIMVDLVVLKLRKRRICNVGLEIMVQRGIVSQCVITPGKSLSLMAKQHEMAFFQEGSMSVMTRVHWSDWQMMMMMKMMFLCKYCKIYF